MSNIFDPLFATIGINASTEKTLVDRIKEAILQQYRVQKPNAIIVQGDTIKNQTYHQDVILIANAIEHVTSNCALLAFASSYTNVIIGNGASKLLMFFREGETTTNLDIHVLSKAHVDVTFLCENPQQTFFFDGQIMNLQQFSKWWIQNKIKKVIS